MTFGQRIQRARHHRGLTLEGLASRVGSHKGYMSGIENGTCRPPAPGLTGRLARVLGLDLELLLVEGWAEKAPKRVRSQVMEAVELWRRSGSQETRPDLPAGSGVA